MPKKAIAQQPLVSRGSSRLLVGEEPVKHKKTKDLPDLLQEGDLLVLNETRVMPSRMRFRKATGGLVEILALEEREGGSWEALIRPSKKVPAGTDLTNDDGDSVIRIGETSDIGTRYVYPLHESMQELFHKYGEVPLPPYIEGSLEDDERY
ncbi:MAG: S-adenosylmethionine:tRNA ribosyltransferase-isomerase, partial [Acidimicrobiales bacterium]|nr:S-adenosylmethionine:tRNA ribosyltransferase-isomerase [Acidimicrobiales bacterium]